MLQMQNTRLSRSVPENLADGVIIQEEGSAMVYVKQNGVTKVALSAGTAGEIFAGVSIARYMPPGIVPVFEKITLDAAGKGTLSHAPATGKALFKIGSQALTIVTAAPASATELEVTGTAIQADVTQAGSVVVAQYGYAPTVEEARQILGDPAYGGLSANSMGTVQVIKVAKNIATSFFDMAQDWTNTLKVKLGANGMFVPATVNDGLQNVVVLNTPNEGNPFLVLELNVA